MKRKLLSVLCLLLCVALLPIAGCEKKAASPTPIEFPVEGFTWGMTLEEAEAAVHDMLAGNALGDAGHRIVIE